MTSVVDVLKTIADDKSLVLFNTIAVSNDIFIGILGLTRKQYYSRLSALLKAGLVKRESGKYSLTTFGIIIYHIQEIIGKAVDQYWKLKAIDSFRASCDGEMPQERHKALCRQWSGSCPRPRSRQCHYKNDTHCIELSKRTHIPRFYCSNKDST